MRITKDRIEDFEYYQNQNIDYIVIDENVKRIGEKAFAKCSNLIRVVVEYSEEPVHICIDAFTGCKNLVEIQTKRETLFFKKIRHGKEYHFSQ